MSQKSKHILVAGSHLTEVLLASGHGLAVLIEHPYLVLWFVLAADHLVVAGVGHGDPAGHESSGSPGPVAHAPARPHHAATTQVFVQGLFIRIVDAS